MVCIRSIIAPLCGLGEVADIVQRCRRPFGEIGMLMTVRSRAWLNPLHVCTDLRFAAVFRFTKTRDMSVDFRPAYSISGLGIGIKGHCNDSKTHTRICDSSGTC